MPSRMNFLGKAGAEVRRRILRAVYLLKAFVLQLQSASYESSILSAQLIRKIIGAEGNP